MNITGIPGLQGAQGIQGIQGIQGLIGTQGSIGIQGLIGTQGSVGIQGLIGTQGSIGITGTQGSIGLTGTQGSIGLTGTQGSIGIQGLIGTQGSIGLTGTQGSIGLTGTQGSIGITGTQGSIGPIGTQGSTGVTVTSNNYVWGVKSNTQAGTTAFSNIIYTSTPEINGWTYNTTGNFTCTQSGKYTVSYMALINGTTGSTHVGSVRAAINGSELIGSVMTQPFINNSDSSNTFILTIAAGQTLSIQFAGSSGTESLYTTPAFAGETSISSTIKITRLI